MIRPDRLGKLATMAILPLMAIVAVIAARAGSGSATTMPVPATGLLVVASLRGESLTFFDLERGAVTTLALPGPPHELAEAGGRLYVTLGRGNALAEVDPRAPGILRLLRLEGEPHGLAVDGDLLLVTLDKADALVTIDRATLTETAREPTSETPHAVAAEGGQVFVAAARANELREVRPGTARVGTGALPESVSVTGTVVAVAEASAGSVSLFARDGLAPLGRVATGGEPVRVQALPGGRVAAALPVRSRVAIIDAAKSKVVRSWKTVSRPDGLCVDPTGRYLAVAGNGANAVQLFRLDDGARTEPFAAGDGPGACAWLAR